MGSKVYVESTIISYLAARPSSDPIVKAHQFISEKWWSERRAKFDLVISEQVILEIEAGDPEAAQRRVSLARDIPIVRLNADVEALASRLVRVGAVPATSIEDVTHIAAATVHGAEYLITWNCRHIPNATVRNLIEKTCWESGYVACIICTPEELMTDE